MDLSVYASYMFHRTQIADLSPMLQKASHAMSRCIKESKKSFLHIILLFIVNKINSVPPQNNDLFSEGGVFFQFVQLIK